KPGFVDSAACPSTAIGAGLLPASCGRLLGFGRESWPEGSSAPQRGALEFLGTLGRTAAPRTEAAGVSAGVARLDLLLCILKRITDHHQAPHDAFGGAFEIVFLELVGDRVLQELNHPVRRND